MADVIKVELTSEQVFESLPIDFLEGNVDPSQGFKEKVLTIHSADGDVSLEISYDGESELLAKVLDAPKHMNLSDVKITVQDYFES